MNLPLTHTYKDKVVVITGAGGVLCGDMARAYVKAGAKVAALDRNEDAVKALADEMKSEGYICEGYKANVLDAEELENVHKKVLSDLGPCDILINGAGGNNPRATTDNEYQHEAKEWDHRAKTGIQAQFRVTNSLGTMSSDGPEPGREPR